MVEVVPLPFEGSCQDKQLAIFSLRVIVFPFVFNKNRLQVENKLIIIDKTTISFVEHMIG